MICESNFSTCLLFYFVVFWHGIPISKDHDSNSRMDNDLSNSKADIPNIFTGFSKDSSVSSDIKDKEQQAIVGKLRF